MNSLDPKYFAMRQGVEAKCAAEWAELLRKALKIKLPPRPLGKYTPPQIAVEDGAGVFEGLK